MDNALAALVQSGVGTGAPTNPSSRYYGSGVEQMTLANGTVVSYLARRIIPKMSLYTQTQNYTVVAGDRLDNLAARFLGDPILFWMIAEANGAEDANELTAEPGRVILIPLVSGIPPGARNG
ncbi:MAG TPA: LysM domain-containing protein [Terracidiphilus sp.]|jgi:nucleoid-associated protein YgaU|nr:LysM domain-containing protein [Terracidiphilus sp.]